MKDLSDKKFIDLCHQFEAHDGDKVLFIISKDPFFYPGLLSPIKRSIEGITYQIGFYISDRFKAESIANQAIKIISENIMDVALESIEARLLKCIGTRELSDLIECELQIISKKYSEKDSGTEIDNYKLQGYTSEKLKKSPFSYPFISSSYSIQIDRLPNSYLNEKIIWQISEGVADRLLENYLLKAQGDPIKLGLYFEDFDNVTTPPVAIELGKEKDLKFNCLRDIFKNDTLYQKAIDILDNEKILKKSTLKWLYKKNPQYTTKVYACLLVDALFYFDYLIFDECPSIKMTLSIVNKGFKISIGKETVYKALRFWKEKDRNVTFSFLIQNPATLKT